MNIKNAAAALLEAEKTKQPIVPLTSSSESISVDEAYGIQLEQIRHKVQNGAVIVGKKIGLTSKAMQDMFGVHEPDYGHILEDMVYQNGDTIRLDQYIQPKIEMEFSFMLKKDLKGPEVSVDDVIEAVDYVVPSMEIVDSRITDWQIKYEDTVADNGSSAGAVLSENKFELSSLDLPSIAINVYKNGELIDSATGSAVLGNPLRAVAWLANAVGRYGVTLNAGEVILSGAVSKAIPIEDGDEFKAEFDNMGSVSAKFKR